MDAKFGDLQGVVSLLASMHPAWQSATMAAGIRTTRTGKGQAQREEDAEQGELDLNSGSLF